MVVSYKKRQPKHEIKVKEESKMGSGILVEVLTECSKKMVWGDRKLRESFHFPLFYNLLLLYYCSWKRGREITSTISNKFSLLFCFILTQRYHYSVKSQINNLTIFCLFFNTNMQIPRRLSPVCSQFSCSLLHINYIFVYSKFSKNLYHMNFK